MRFYKLLLVILFYTSSVEPYNYGIVQAVERGEVSVTVGEAAVRGAQPAVELTPPRLEVRVVWRE